MDRANFVAIYVGVAISVLAALIIGSFKWLSKKLEGSASKDYVDKAVKEEVDKVRGELTAHRREVNLELKRRDSEAQLVKQAIEIGMSDIKGDLALIKAHLLGDNLADNHRKKAEGHRD